MNSATSGVGVSAHRDRGDEPPARPIHRAQKRRGAECLQQGPRRTHPRIGQWRGHRQQLDVAQEVAGGGVDQRDGIGALRYPFGIPLGPRCDRDATHRVSGDNGTLGRGQRRLEHGVEVGRQDVEAVAMAARWHRALAVPAVVERDDAVIGGQVRYLVGPYPEGARDAVREHDRVAVLRSEDLGVQADTVLGTNGNDATPRQCLGRGESSGRRTGPLATSHCVLPSISATLPELPAYRSVGSGRRRS